MRMGAGFLTRARPRSGGLHVQCRWISSNNSLQSGHNRWSKIKHDKGANDKAKSRERTLLSHAVMLASKYGGSDPNLNSKLAIAIANAKRGQLSKTSIESAIAKGQGKSLSGAPLEALTLEAMLPHGVAAMIEYHTESKAKVLSEARALINKSGGNITATSFLFEKKGRIWFQEDSGIGVDEAMEDAIEAGATDIAVEDGRLVVVTEPNDLTTVSRKLQDALKLPIERAEVVFEPKDESMVELASEESEVIARLLDKIEEEPSLQNVYINAAI